MIGLGILAAGAAQGAANASNMNVQAQNQLELDQNREALREEYLNKRFDKELAVGRENAKAAGLLRAQEYERNRSDKLTDAEMKHKQAMEIEGRRDNRSAAVNATRLKAAAMRKEGGGEDIKGVMLPDGTMFKAGSSEFKFISDGIATGQFKDYAEGLDFLVAKGLVSQAAGSPKGLVKGIVPEAQSMSGELLNRQQKPQSVLKEWNPKTGKFE